MKDGSSSCPSRTMAVFQCKEYSSYPYDCTVESCHSFVREKSAKERWFNYPNMSVESDKTHIQNRSNY